VSSVNGKIVFGNDDGIYTINLDGIELEKLCSIRSGGYPILWSPDGSKIAFRGDVNGDYKKGICVVNSDGSVLKEITDPTIEVKPPPSRAFDWIPDVFHD
jgi:hypothetical protein